MTCILDRAIYPLRYKNTNTTFTFQKLVGTGEPCTFYKCENGRGKRIALFLHGNMTQLADTQKFVQPFSNATSCDVVSITFNGYPGHDLSCVAGSGEQYDSEISLKVALVARELCTKYDEIVLVGHSLGCAGIISSLKHFVPRKGSVLLISPFASLRSVVKSKYGTILSKIIPQSRLNNMVCATSCTLPIMITHGIDDTIIPPCESSKLILTCKNAAKQIRKTYANTGHELSSNLGHVIGNDFNLWLPPSHAPHVLNLQFRS